MLKRNLLKRVLPIALSFAMAFQSVPMTALASEIPSANFDAESTVVSVEDHEGGTDMNPPAGTEDGTDTNVPAGGEGGTGTNPSVGGEDGTDTNASVGAEADTDTNPPAGTDDGTDTDSVTGTENGTEAGSNNGTNTDTDTEPATGTNTDTGAESEPAAGTEADTAEPGQDTQISAIPTKIIVDPSNLYLPEGFRRESGENRLTYSIMYGEIDEYGDTIDFRDVIDSVKYAAAIEIDGTGKPALKDDYLILEWKEVQKAGDGTEILTAMTEVPRHVGSYALHLQTRETEGICGVAEYNVYFNITPRKLELALGGSAEEETELLTVKAGSRIVDFKKAVEDACVLTDGTDEFNGLQYHITVKVYKDGDADASAETTDIFFNRDGDYRVGIEVTLDDVSNGSYEVSGRECLIHFDGLLRTRVDVEIRNPGSEIVKTYEKNKTYKTSEIAEEFGLSFEVKAESKDNQGSTIYVPLGDDVADADRQAIPKWYKKELNKDSNGNPIISDFPTQAEVDGITRFYQGNALYTLMEEESLGEVGEYYLVYVFEGVNGRYEKSHSDPVKVTIDPVEVILVPTKVAELNTGMTNLALKKALAEVESELRKPDAADAALAGAEKSDAPFTDKDFYGVSYEDTMVTQYYSPVFELVRQKRTRLPEAQWPANATEEQKWSAWVFEKVETGKDADAADLKLSDDTAEYKYYIRFTGQKAVYAANGSKTSERPVTEATDAANCNYKVKTDSYTLDHEKNMLEVSPGKAAETSIDVSAIIASFNKTHGKGGSGLTADDPAWMIYDADAALFADKAAYKKAVVTGTDIKDTHKDLTYTWQSSGEVDLYDQIIHMEKNEDETDEAFAARKEEAVKELESTFRSNVISPIPQDAGLYRLHITYQDNALVPVNGPAAGDAYFLIKKQELMLVADMQYAKYGDDVREFTKNGYRMFALPDNDESRLDLAAAEPLNWLVSDPDDLEWQAVNLKKNADGSDTAEWERSSGIFVKNDTHPYVYKAAVWFDDWYADDYNGDILDTNGNKVTNKAGKQLRWGNYTTRNRASWDAENGEYRHHMKVGEGFGDIRFDAAEIEVVVDRSKLFTGKIYDGKPIADRLPEGFIKLTDKASGEEIPATELKVNGEPQDGVDTVRVEWVWTDTYYGNIVPTGEIKYGGTYRLAANFEGNDTYGPIADRGNSWVELADKAGQVFEFEIKPLEVEITPVLKDEVTAGEPASEMLENWHVEARATDPARKIPDGTDGSSDDRWLFERGSGSRWNAIAGYEQSYTDSYPILGNGDGVAGEEFEAVYYEDTSRISAYTKIRYGREYKVMFGNGDDLYAQYELSYKLTHKAASLADVIRGDAKAEATPFFKNTIDNNTKDGSVSVHTEKDADGTHMIIPREGIPFVYDGYEFQGWVLRDNSTHSLREWKTVKKDLITGEEIPLNKNYIAVNIISPSEFDREFDKDYDFATNNFVYGNSIKSAGGYVLTTFGNYLDGVNRYFITVLFPVELDQDGKVIDPEKKFSVTWEKGYTENFNLNLTNAKVEANLKEASAPKALAFNGVQPKMAVGEEQQLDVKITKQHLGDVVWIRYRLAGGATSNEYASINPETGRITALATNNGKPAAVNVEAYPVRLGADGKTFVEITGKGVKVAKAKVTVTEVTAPVIKKVIPTDVSAEVQFTRVDNGYRGELYVVKLENKKDANKWKATDFETAIGKMKNGQWQGTFAVSPMYFAGTRGYSETLKICRQKITSLESGAYVVYVRNVSAVRTLADGSKVTESAAGTVKTFETTRLQVKGLTPYFEVEAEKTKQNPVRYYNGKDASDGYMVELGDKSAQLMVNGWFPAKPLDAAADLTERTQLPLSLKTAEKILGIKLTDKYLDPKLSYYVTDDGSLSLDGKNKLINPSKYAVISNKGKLTFKGVDRDGAVTVYVWVRADNGILSQCRLTITARPDTLTTKKVKTMKVGDGIRLADYLEYRQGKAKIPYYWSSNIEITNREELEKAGFRIYQAADSGESHPSVEGRLRAGEYIIIAVKDGGKCDLKFKDQLWKTGLDEKVQTEEKALSLTTAKLDPVKGLKAVYTDDKHITLNFTHGGHPEAFDIEVKDARGGIVYKRLAYREQAMKNTVYASAEAWLQNQQRAILSQFKYFEKTKTYAYTIYTEKLMRLSSYTISVTPVYEGESAVKPASAKAKTTDIPASYGNGDITNPDYNYSGISIGSLTTYLTSGNTYTLTADGVQNLAKIRGTDTLTWKSSNTKVAFVKPNQGTYSATLKAVQQGRTTITVTSKVTKKTIARYHVAVKAVGNGSGYGGDYENGGGYQEFYDSFIKTVDPYYAGRIEVLTVSNSVEVTEEDLLMRDNDWKNSERTWVQFTAPSYGEYTFDCVNASGTFSHLYNIYYSNAAETDSSGRFSGTRTLRLEEGQKIYFKVADTFKLYVKNYTDFTKLTVSCTKDRPLKVGAKAVWVSFTAPEENYYTFHGSIEQYEQDGRQIYPVDNSLGMKAGETVFLKVRAGSELYVTRREAAGTLTTGGDGVNMTFHKDNAEDTQYVSFRADVTGDYSFTYSPSDRIGVEFLAVDGDTKYADGGAVLARRSVMEDPAEPEAPAEPAKQTVRLFIEGGETVMIAVRALNPEEITDDAKKIVATIKVVSSEVKALEGRQTVEKGTSQTFEFTIPDDTTAANYAVGATDGAAVAWYYSKTKKETGNSWESDTELAEISGIAANGHSFTVEKGKVTEPVLTGKKSLIAGDRIYIKVTADVAADSVVTLTRTVGNKTFDGSNPADIELETGDGAAQWYTFTAEKDGYYKFYAKVTTTPAESAADAQSVMIEHVDKVFSDDVSYDPYIGLYGGNGVMTSAVRKLTAGSYVFRVAATSAAAENVKTTVALSVKEIVPTAIVKGDTPVAMAADEEKYYSFQAATNDRYLIQWVPDAESGAAVAYYTTGGLDHEFDGMFDEATPVTVDSPTDTCFIKIVSTGDRAVSGKLQVTVDEKRFLISGKVENFEFKEDGSAEYIFTIPEDNRLGYVVTVENTSEVNEEQELNGQKPYISVQTDLGADIVVNLTDRISSEMINWTTAHRSIRLTISATNTTPADPATSQPGISATGSILISPVIVQEFVEAAGKINRGDAPEWYACTIPEDGRYVFDYTVGTDQDKSGVEVNWYRKSANGARGAQVYTEDYLTKGQELYVIVKPKRSIAEEGVDVTLKTPALIPATALTLTDGKAEVEVTEEMLAQGVVYYTLTAPAYARYILEGYGEIKRYVPVKDQYGNLSDKWNNRETLEKDEQILIKVKKAGKLTITSDFITKLTLDQMSEEITIGKNETAMFSLNIFESGYYDFKISDANGLRTDINSEEKLYEDTSGRCYSVAYIDKEKCKGCFIFTVSNPGEEAAVLAVTAGKLEPVSLKLGTTDLPVSKDRITVTEFHVPEDYWYTFECSEGSRLSRGQYLIGSPVFWEKSAEGDRGVANAMEYTGAEMTDTAQITISKLEVEPVSGDTIPLSLESGEQKWYAYSTTVTGRYTFTAPDKVRLWFCRSLSKKSGSDDTSPGVKADTVLYIRASNGSGQKLEGDGANITITCEEAEELQVDVPFSVAQGTEKYLTFKAPEDGFYSIDSVNDSANADCLFYGRNDWNGGYQSGSGPYFMAKGVVVYFKVSGSVGDAEIKISKTQEAEAVGYVAADAGYQWLTFTAPADGAYTFASTNQSGDPKAWFFRNMDVGDDANESTLDRISRANGYGYDDNSGEPARNFLKAINLTAGETVYIAVGHCYLSTPVSCDVYVIYE